MTLNVLFMGTPDFAVPALQGIIDAKYNVVGVYSQPPRPSGRGQKERKSPIHILADKNNIPVKTPKNFKDKSEIEVLKKFNPDIIICLLYTSDAADES